MAHVSTPTTPTTPDSAPLPPAVNFHLWRPCNMGCRFCFAAFDDDLALRQTPVREEQLSTVCRLAEDPRISKITFVGGEPTLCPWLEELVTAAHQRGVTTAIVTNGLHLMERAPWIFEPNTPLHWLGLSVDSLCAETNRHTGRHQRGTTVSMSELRAIVARAREAGLRIKINTVVSTANAGEDMASFIQEIRPDRWKVFQVLPVTGQNDDAEDLFVQRSIYNDFVERHRRASPVIRQCLVREDNEIMRGSYAMLDPLGRFFDNVDGGHRYGARITDVGIDTAWSTVRFREASFRARDGLYDWDVSAASLSRARGDHETRRRGIFLVLAGQSGVGKDTAAQVLLSRGWTRIAIADPLKRGLKAMLALDEETLWGDRRNDPIEHLGVSARGLFQEVSDVLRRHDPNVWIRPWQRSVQAALEAGNDVVCTDLRTREELEAARALGALAFLLKRPSAGAPGPLSAHDTEAAFIGEEDAFDAVLRNEGDLEHLQALLEEALSRAR